MVHALGEAWRVLKAGGRLIEMRPQAAGWPVEVIDGEKLISVGRLDDHKRANLDKITDEAVAEAVRRGWFEAEKDDLFEFAYDWDSVDGMKAYIDEEWENHASFPPGVLADAHRLMDMAGTGALVRIRRTIMIARYRKLAA